MPDHNHDPLRPHSHEPNPEPPSADPTFTLELPDGRATAITVVGLQQLPEVTLENCYIISTGHGTSGPFAFTGVRLVDLVEHFAKTEWSQVEVISADGFGNRIMASELVQPDPAGPILLAYAIDGRPMTRQEGLVRLIVPSERDDALRQVKWIGRINIRP
ncbi:MAG TPA: molybdopterin-dependent oxidoreductase [Anaerolineae bacterium]